MNVFQTGKKLGAALFLDEGRRVECKQPELFPGGTASVKLSQLRGREVGSVLFTSEDCKYIVQGNELRFSPTPVNSFLVLPKKSISVLQKLKKDQPTKLFFAPVPGQTVTEVTISSLDFFSGKLGELQFAKKKAGPFTPTLALDTSTDFWIKGTVKKKGTSLSMYLTFSGVVYL